MTCKKTGGEGLDIQAWLAVAGWRFHPAKLNGQPVAVQISVDRSGCFEPARFS